MPIELRRFRCTTRFVMFTALCSDSRWLFGNNTPSTFGLASPVTAVTLYIFLTTVQFLREMCRAAGRTKMDSCDLHARGPAYRRIPCRTPQFCAHSVW